VPSIYTRPLTLILSTNFVSLSPSLPLSLYPTRYDKIESGSLQLEFMMVPVWKCVQRTFVTFALQAREKEIVFQLQGEMFGADASLQLVGDLGTLQCVGDATRITQVCTFPLLSYALLAPPLT
jgi:hypothetical protein